MHIGSTQRTGRGRPAIVTPHGRTRARRAGRRIRRRPDRCVARLLRTAAPPRHRPGPALRGLLEHRGSQDRRGHRPRRARGRRPAGRRAGAARGRYVHASGQGTPPTMAACGVRAVVGGGRGGAGGAVRELVVDRGDRRPLRRAPCGTARPDRRGALRRGGRQRRGRAAPVGLPPPVVPCSGGRPGPRGDHRGRIRLHRERPVLRADVRAGQRRRRSRVPDRGDIRGACGPDAVRAPAVHIGDRARARLRGADAAAGTRGGHRGRGLPGRCRSARGVERRGVEEHGRRRAARHAVRLPRGHAAAPDRAPLPGSSPAARATGGGVTPVAVLRGGRVDHLERSGDARLDHRPEPTARRRPRALRQARPGRHAAVSVDRDGTGRTP